MREERLCERIPPLPLGFPKASRAIHACGAHNEADFREFGEYEGERTAMPGEQAMFGWEVVYTKFFGVPVQIIATKYLLFFIHYFSIIPHYFSVIVTC